MEVVNLARCPIHPPCYGQVRRPSGACVRLVHGSGWIALGLLMALAVISPPTARAEPTEQEVKAALIFNITRFVEWPASSFASPTAPLVVAILGQDDVSDVLETMLRHKSVNNHPLEVRHVQSLDDARKCHVVYVATSERRRADAILEVLRGTSTLTVADIEHFAERGGHFNLELQDRRVHIIANPTSAATSRLKISARLLSLADIVGATP